MSKLCTLLLISMLGLSNASISQTTFYYTGSVQTWTVPTGVTSITVNAQGAEGGNNSNTTITPDRPGYGACVVCTMNVTPGQVLDIYVGGAGAAGTTTAGGTGGYNGGGNGGFVAVTSYGPYSGGGGGGASDIRVSPYALGNRVIVAAGGGGAGANYVYLTNWERGGDGGGATGESGYAANTLSGLGAGSGGTPVAGGTCGYYFACAGGAGISGTGGNGCNPSTGGGGGGGYFGGAGGSYGGGGGGSSYTDAALCSSVSHTRGCNSSGNGSVTITVNCTAGTISGTLTVCAGSTTTLTDTTGGSSGTWSSSNTSVATVGSSTGVVTGVSSGTATISYTVTLACGTVSATAVVTVNPLPVITGSTTVCAGSNTTLSSSSGATWTSGTTSVATIGSSTGVVTGVSSGTSTITCTLPTGCKSTIVVTVNPLPSVITGTASVCLGFTTTLSDSTSGGTWSSSSTTVATVGSGTGVVTGNSTGTATITYMLSTGCYKTKTVTVNPLPGAITGLSSICAGTSTTLTDISAGGTWTSGTTSVATVGSTSGTVTGVSGGTSTITYTLATGCLTTFIMTVNPAPSAIQGTLYLCTGTTTTLTDTTGSGLWSSSNNSVATIGSTTGLVTAISPGIDTITYTLLTTGCTAKAILTVNPNPSPITGVNNVCLGFTSTLSDFTTGGSWVSTTTSVATIGSSTGEVSGLSIGTSVISYVMPTGCYATTTATVNNNPAPISGSSLLCTGQTTTETDASPGGSWSSSNSLVASIGTGSGIASGISAGTAIITYTATLTGCYATLPVTVNSTSTISGATTVCAGSTTPLSSSCSSSAAWSSSNTAIATAGSSTGIVTGISAGAATITCLCNGCAAAAVVTVNPVPAPITGPTNVCVGLTITDADVTPGGTWSSSAPSIATVGSTTGVITGIIPGTSTISYTLSTGCAATVVITVNAAPSPITGIRTVCVGLTTLLSDVTSGGTWSSGTTSVATVGSGSGVVSGISGGTSIITYSLGSSCSTTATVTVNNLPSPISGSSVVCAGASILFTDLVPGGTWSSSTPSVATVGSSSGVVTGVSGGTATISYATGSGCYVTKLVSVNAAPTLYTVTGGGTYCTGGTGVHIGLSGSTLGVSYQLYLGGAPVGIAVTGTGAAIDFGLVTGAGTYTVVATNGAGCSITMTGAVTVSINPLPLAYTVIGGGSYCAGGSGVMVELGGSSPGVSYQLMLGTMGLGTLTGTGTALNFGFQTVAGIYTVVATDLTTGCTNTMTGSATVTIDPPPAPIVGPTALCAGTSITLTDGTPGGGWTSSNPSVATIGLTTGIVNGITTGTTTITYTSFITTCYTTINVTVSVSPGPISGPSGVCVGQTITLTDPIGGGTWLCGTTALATVGSLSGVVTGVSTGSPIITYTLGTGCTVYKTISVNAAPSAIAGTASICVGGTSTLTDPTPSGTWSSSTPSIATITPGGVVTGVVTGNSTISYTVAGCPATLIVTVNPTPTAITGPATVCVGSSVTLADPVGGGVWSSTSPLVSVGSSSGSVTGVSGGTATITYAIGSCNTTRSITVNATAPITGSTGLCVGSTSTLSDALTGGSWSSSAPSIATIGSSTGLVTGITTGTATITYTLSSGCIVTTTVTVNTTPGAISGPTKVCAGSTITLTDVAGGGTWTSATPSVATIGSSSGIVTGVSAGTTVISYSLGSGCLRTTTITVNPVPAAISGLSSICAGLSAAYTDATTGGTWSSTVPTVATIGVTSGIANAITTGATVISYTFVTTGCAATETVNVTPTPGTVTGSLTVCVGQTTSLSNTVPGGTWMSSTTSVATIGSSSGVVSGITPGTSVIVYTLGGCSASATVTVTPLPVSIGGPTHACVGHSITLTDATTGGTWSTTIGTIATIGSTSGILTGISSGTVLVSYTLSSGCAVATPIVVNPVSPILGNPTVCAGLTTVLTDTSLGGYWSSSAPTIASVGSATGIVTGVVAGTCTITYNLPTGCFAIQTVTVTPSPAPITGTATVCVGQVTPLFDASTGGTWSSSNPAIASVNTSGVVSGMATGTATISYTYLSGCPALRVVTVNPLPLNIVGPGNVCIGSTISLLDPTPGGTWSSSIPTVGTVSTTGIVSGLVPGTTSIIYTLISTGCANSTTVTVNSLPSAITGTLKVCVGSTTTLSDASIGGNWSSLNPSIATVDMYSGLVSGITPGSVLISYTLSTGCTTSAVVTVNPVPAAIAGPSTVCQGSTITLTDISPGGVWSSTSPSTATVGSGTGIVTGVSTGVTTISYTAGNGCAATSSVFVNPTPAPISGSAAVCIGLTSTLSDATPFGTWSSSAPLIAPVSPIGVVTGLALGTATISYTLTTGCAASMIVTVNPLPAPISGSTNVCVGSITTLSDAIGGGTWSSISPGVATIGSSSGLMTGISAGTTTIVYTLGAGCTTSVNITVNPLPSPITGPTTVCATQSMTLYDATPGGTWTSSSPATATVGSSTGDVIGIAAGSVTISYTAGCTATYNITVNPMPGPILGSANVCLGGTSALHDTLAGGTWYSTNTSIATVGSSSGVVSGISLGSCNIIYQAAGGCFVSEVITVYPLPTVFTITGGGSHCAGDTGVHIGLSGSTLGVNYMLYRGTTAVGTFAGTGTRLDFGLQTVGGTYTATGTSAVTGCSINMAGSVSITTIPSVVPTVSFNATPGDTVCAGTSTSFAASAVNGGSSPMYEWRINSFPVGLGGGYTYIPANGDTVSVKMTSSATCATPATVTHSVIMTVQPYMISSVAIGITPGDTVCRGTVVTLHPESTYGGSHPAFYWFKNAAPEGTGSTYTFMPNDGDVVYCTMNSNYPCRLANADTSRQLTITVDTPVYPAVTINTNPGVVVGIGQSDTFTAVVANPILPTYQWYINGVPVPGATNATFVGSNFSYPNEDSVSCTVTNNGVCTMTSHQWVYIIVSSVSVKPVNANTGDILIVPNPNNGTFIIKGSIGVADEHVSIEMTDLLGQVVYRTKTTAIGGKLNEHVMLSNMLTNGMYMLTVRTETDTKVFHVVIEQ